MKHLSVSFLIVLFCLLGIFSVPTMAQDYSQMTNLPAIYINTFDRKPITSKTDYIYATLYYVDETGVVKYDSMEIRGRGNSTWGLAKKPYRIKFKQKEKFMGSDRAKAKSWTLIANFVDKTLIRNAVAACIGDFAGQPFTAGAQFVDLVLNGTYLGNYQLSDQVEVRKKRVEVEEQDEVLTEESNITGGYFIEVDGFGTSEPVYFRTNKNVIITVKYPDDDVIVNSQKNYIKNHLQLFEDALFSADFAHKEKGYRQYVDSLTLASWYISTELTGNVDGFWSTYMYKKQDDPKFYWGPLWDYDIAFNNCNRVGDVSNALMTNKGFGSDLAKVWILQMWKDPWFVHLINRTWKECVERGFEDYVMNYIDSITGVINRSQILNFQKWPINQRVYNEITLYSTYQEGVDYLKLFLRKHFDYLTRTFENAAEDIGEIIEPAPDFVLDDLFYYRISNRGNGNSIDAVDGNTGAICTWSSDFDRKSQLWEIKQAGDYYQLINSYSGLAITDCATVMAGGNYQAGSQLEQRESNEIDTRQLWSFVPINTGNSYIIVNKQTNLAMNNSGSGATNGTSVISWKNDADNASKNTRQWRIEKDEQKPVNSVAEAPVHAVQYAVLYNQETQQVHFVAEDIEALSGVADIYSANGQKMLSFSVRETADVAHLSNGMYILRWVQDGRQYSVKFMKH